MSRGTHNEARNAEIIQRRKAGEGPRQIARDMGVTAQAVVGVLFRAGLTSGASGSGRGNGATVEFKRIVLAAASRTTQAEAGALYGVSRRSIYAWLREAA